MKLDRPILPLAAAAALLLSGCSGSPFGGSSSPQPTVTVTTTQSPSESASESASPSESTSDSASPSESASSSASESSSESPSEPSDAPSDVKTVGKRGEKFSESASKILTLKLGKGFLFMPAATYKNALNKYEGYTPTGAGEVFAIPECARIDAGPQHFAPSEGYRFGSGTESGSKVDQIIVIKGVKSADELWSKYEALVKKCANTTIRVKGIDVKLTNKIADLTLDGKKVKKVTSTLTVPGASGISESIEAYYMADGTTLYEFMGETKPADATVLKYLKAASS